MFKTIDQLHVEALMFSEDSSKIKSSMTVIKLGFVVAMLSDMQSGFEKIINDKDIEILELKNQLLSLK